MAIDDRDLSERLRSVKMREAENVDDERILAAIKEKQGLAERIHGIANESLARDLADHHETEAEQQVVPETPVVPVRPGTGSDAFLKMARPLEYQEGYEPEAPRQKLVDWLFGKAVVEEDHGPVTYIPPVTPGWREVEFRELEPPFSFVRVEKRDGSDDIVYRVIEPQLRDHEAEALTFVQDAFVRGLNVNPSAMRIADRERYLTTALEDILRDYRIRLSPRGRARIEYFLRRDFLGLGLIHVLMLDPDIEDISCDGPGIPIFIFHRRFESVPTSLHFKDDTHVDGFVIRLAQRSGRAISISDPILDAALPDGSRLQATLGQEVTQNGSTFTIRRFKPDPFTPIDLIRFGTLNAEVMAWFWLNVQHGNSLIFAGGTASGKTTSLNAIAQFIPLQAKIVTIEDTREVNLPHLNWIKAVTRSGSTVEGTGEIGMFALLKASLRQRPEYIVVGEVRGVEATVAFQAMATGHTVYSTLHADSARSVVYRLENDPINVPRLVLQALDIIAVQTQTRVNGVRVRRLREVVELVGLDPTTRELLTNTVFRWNPVTDEFDYKGRSYMLEQLAQQRNWTMDQMENEFHARRDLLQAVIDARGDPELPRLVRMFYRDPEHALRMVKGQ